jgi:hypothetical protein
MNYRSPLAASGRNPKTPLTDVRSSADSARHRAARVSKRFYHGLLGTTGLFFALVGTAAAQTPDMILINGKLLTVDAKDSVADAVAIAKGKIVAVGSNAEIQRLGGPTTRMVDLHGLTATPGLIDTHGHFADGGVDEMFHVVLSDIQRVGDALDKIREKATTLKPGEWLVGAGCD